MRLLTRIIPFMAGVAIAASYLTVILLPDALVIIIGLSVLIVGWATWELTGQVLRRSRFWNFLIGPVLLVLTGWGTLVFVQDRWLAYSILIIMSCAVWLLLQVTMLYLHLRPQYQPHALENIASYLAVVIIYSSAVGLFQGRILLAAPLWLLDVTMMVVVILTTYYVIWLSDISTTFSRLYLVVVGGIMGELFIAVSFLPTSVYVNALVLTIMYYSMLGLSRNWLLGIKDVRVVRRYIGAASLLIMLTFLTAKWL